jgi:DNA-binding transcriptional LysR family regulator
VELTAAGRALLEEAPRALAGLERAADRARLAGAGIAATVRLGYAPMASFETLGAIVAAVEDDNPNTTVVAKEIFSAEIPGRVLAGEFDIGLALHPEPGKGLQSESLRIEPLAALLSKRHRFADGQPIRLASLEGETLLLFPRELAPAYYDLIIAACERIGFQPRVSGFPEPSILAMLARLPRGREVGLTPASFAFHAADAEPGVIALKIVDPEILAEWSLVWPVRSQTAAIARFLDSARRCAGDNGWLRVTDAHQLSPKLRP